MKSFEINSKKFIDWLLKKINLKLLKHKTYLNLIDRNKNQYFFDFKFINLIKNKADKTFQPFGLVKLPQIMIFYRM
jgi:hypothetical protein